MIRSNPDLQKQGAEIDPILHPFLSSTDEDKSEALLQALLEQHAEPIIRNGITRKLFLISVNTGMDHPERNVEDLCSETRLNLLRTLRQIKAQPGRKRIHNFSGYVSTVVRQVCDQQLRRLNPNRFRLQNQLRYLCSHNSQFAIWENAEGILVAGFAVWKNKDLEIKKPDIATVHLSIKRPTGQGTAQLISLCRSVFEELKGPVEFDTLVRIAETVMGVTHLRYESLTFEDQFSDPAKAADERLHNQRYFQALWSEIVLLPPAQRTAILLGLKDSSGRPLLPYFPLLKVASLEEIADQFPFSNVEFVRIWNNLPLADRDLGDILQATPQQVANLRKCARERLTRRLKKFSSKGNK